MSPTQVFNYNFGLGEFEFPMLENLFQRGGFIAFRLRTDVTIWDI